MNGSGHKLLARPVFAQDQYIGLGVCDPFDLFKYLFHGLRAADKAIGRKSGIPVQDGLLLL